MNCWWFRVWLGTSPFSFGGSVPHIISYLFPDLQSQKVNRVKRLFYLKILFLNFHNQSSQPLRFNMCDRRLTIWPSVKLIFIDRARCRFGRQRFRYLFDFTAGNRRCSCDARAISTGKPHNVLSLPRKWKKYSVRNKIKPKGLKIQTSFKKTQICCYSLNLFLRGNYHIALL